jgi:hypothetical protein
MEVAEAIESLKIEADNYMRTVHALKAMANELLWDASAKRLSKHGLACFGSRLETSSLNRISPNNRVTPDLVVTVPSRQNVLVEAKLAVSGDKDKRRAKLLQVQKYDDDLRGFADDPQGRAGHDIVLLVSMDHARNIQGDIQELEESGQIRFDRPFALIRFFRSDERKTWFVLEVVSGSLTDTDKTEKLRGPLQIDLEHLISNRSFGHIKFYDAEPPLPLLMIEMHELVVGSLTRGQAQELRESNQVDVSLTVELLREQMAEVCGPINTSLPRTPEIPRKRWIGRALEGFREMGWASKQSDGTYVYHVKRRRDPLEQFYSLCAKRKCKTALQRQQKQEKDAKKYPLFGDQIRGKK